MSTKDESKVISLLERMDELEEHQKSLVLESGRDIDPAQELWSVETKALLDAKTLKSLFFSEDWVFIVVDLVASEISGVPILLKKRQPDGSKEEIEEHPVLDLFEQPNQWQDYHSFIYQNAVEYNLMGNIIVWQSANGLINIPTDEIQIEFNNDGTLKSYNIVRSDETGLFQGVLDSLNPDEIVHVRRPNPGSFIWGLSPFIPGSKSVLFNRYSQDFLNSFYQKGALPGLAIKMEKNVNERAALRMLRSFEMAHTGRRNQRRNMVLPKGTDVEQISHSIADQNLIEVVRMNMEKIINLLGVPKHALSLQETGSLGSEEHKQALRYLWTSRLVPTMKRIAGSYTKHFRNHGMLEQDELLEFDLEQVEVLRDNMMKKAEVAREMLATLTPNEVRERVWEQEPVQGGDVLLEVEKIKPTPPMSPEPEPLTTPEPEEEEGRAFGMKAIKVAGDKIEAHIKQMDEEVERRQSTIAANTLDYFSQLAGIAVDLISEVGREKQFTISQQEFRIRFAEAIEDIEQQRAQEQVGVLRGTVETGYNSQVELNLNASAQDAIFALRARDEEKRRQILESRSIRAFSHVTETTTEKIMKEITRGLDENIGGDAIARNIVRNVADPEISNSRANTIARTETLTAFSIGQKAALDNTAEVVPDVKKVWVNAGDNRVRGPGSVHGWQPGDPNHVSLQGVTRGHDKQFPNGLQYPRDLNATNPGQVINCRCTMLTVAPEDLEGLDL